MPHNRKHIRFKPDPLDYAVIDTDIEQPQFKGKFVGLIIDESPMGGCSLVALNFQKLEAAQEIKIKVGRLDPMPAVIRWVKEIQPDVFRYGVEFLE